jgi:hypothetical protein
MGAAEHKLSRREVLAAGCAATAIPLPRHCEERSDAAIQLGASTPTPHGLLRSARNDEKWQRALTRYARAETEIEALKHCEDDDLYDRAVGRQIATLGRLLKAPAPDLTAAAWKLELIVRHAAYELRYGDAAFSVLLVDLRRFAL